MWQTYSERQREQTDCRTSTQVLQSFWILNMDTREHDLLTEMFHWRPGISVMMIWTRHIKITHQDQICRNLLWWYWTTSDRLYRKQSGDFLLSDKKGKHVNSTLRGPSRDLNQERSYCEVTSPFSPWAAGQHRSILQCQIIHLAAWLLLTQITEIQRSYKEFCLCFIIVSKLNAVQL